MGHVISNAKRCVIAINLLSCPWIKDVILALQIHRDVGDPARKGILVIGQPQIDRATSCQTVRIAPMLRSGGNQARKGCLILSPEARLYCEFTGPTALSRTRRRHCLLAFKVNRPDGFDAVGRQYDDQMQVFVLLPGCMQKDDHAALAHPAVNHLARHHRLAHRHGAGLHFHLAKTGRWHHCLCGRREQHRGPKRGCKANQPRGRKSRSHTACSNCRAPEGHSTKNDRWHGLGPPRETTRCKWHAHQALWCHKGGLAAGHDAKSLRITAQNKIAALREAWIGKGGAQQSAAALLKCFPAKLAQHPPTANRRAVASPPKGCMVSAAGQVAVQIKGPCGTIMLAPDEGTRARLAESFGKDLLPMGNARLVHQPRPQVIS